MATHEVARARSEFEGVERAWRQATGVFRTRREHAKARLDRALEAQRRLQEELDRLLYTSRAAFGVRTLYGTSYPEPGGRATFITETSREEMHRRIRALHARLNEMPD